MLTEHQAITKLLIGEITVIPVDGGVIFVLKDDVTSGTTAVTYNVNALRRDPAKIGDDAARILNPIRPVGHAGLSGCDAIFMIACAVRDHVQQLIDDGVLDMLIIHSL